MARWNKLSARGRVTDRRGISGGAAVGGGVIGLVMLLGITYLSGGDPLAVLLENPEVAKSAIGEVTGSQQESVNPEQFAGVDEYELFVSTVLGSNNQYWAGQLPNYQEPELVLFRGSTQSACGGAVSQIGPHYCPADTTIYLDETFFEELANRLGAQGGDVAEAYVIAHEVGHHVQNITGQLSTRQSQQEKIGVELTADCYAGLWANSIKDEGVFGPGEIAEAQDAAAAVGDDRIQQKSSGSVQPETWTHGSAEQRVNAFNLGYETGDLLKCDAAY